MYERDNPTSVSGFQADVTRVHQRRKKRHGQDAHTQRLVYRRMILHRRGSFFSIHIGNEQVEAKEEKDKHLVGEEVIHRHKVILSVKT